MRTETRRLAIMAIGGLVAAGIAATVYLNRCPSQTRSLIFGPLAQAYLVAAVIGGVAQVLGWAALLKANRFRSGLLWLLTIACGTTLLCVAVVREVVRLSAVDISRLYAIHARAAKIDGLPLFLLFFVLNAALIVFCIRFVNRHLHPMPPHDAG